MVPYVESWKQSTHGKQGVECVECHFPPGFANQPESTHAGDGLRLDDAFVTPIVRCAPPANKPTKDEILRCRDYLDREWTLLGPRLRAVLALGRVARDGLVGMLRETGRLPAGSRLAFGHGVTHDLGPGLRLFCSYHPSQQNTFTGRLTPRGFDAVLRRVRAHLGRPAPRESVCSRRSAASR